MANLSDASFIYRLLREFYAKQGGIYRIPMDTESAAETVGDVITRGICLVGPSSCAGALFAPFPFNKEAVIAQVIFWYFQKHQEIKIFEALLTACKVAGATHINAASHFPENTIGKRYLKLGLQAIEKQYMSAL